LQDCSLARSNWYSLKLKSNLPCRPEKFYGDRLNFITHDHTDRTNTRRQTALKLKAAGPEVARVKTSGIHRHMSQGPSRNLYVRKGTAQRSFTNVNHRQSI
jgi:hypothetical protein